LIEINDINDLRIYYYTGLKKKSGIIDVQGIFVSEGEKVTVKLLESKLDIISMLALGKYYEKYSSLINRKNLPKDAVLTAEKNILEQIVGFKIHAGIMAIGKIPMPVAPNGTDNAIIALNGIVDSENVGSIVRNAVAFGYNSLVYDKQTSSPFMRRAVRVSMGTVFGINHYPTQNLYELLNLLKAIYGYKVVAAEILPDSINIKEFNIPEKFIVVFGSEGKGINPEIIGICDYIVSIPINAEVSSLNVAAASGIILHELNNMKIKRQLKK